MMTVRAMLPLFLLLAVGACGRKEAAHQSNVSADLPAAQPMAVNQAAAAGAAQPAANALNQAAAALPGRAVTDGRTIPVAFQGQWAGPDADCSDEASDLRLTVTPTELQFYESVGDVKSVAQAGTQAIIVDAGYTGEGDSWQRRQRLILSRDGRRLTISGPTSSTVRKRCG